MVNVDGAEQAHAYFDRSQRVPIADRQLDHRNRLSTELEAALDGARRRVEVDTGKSQRVHLASDRTRVAQPFRADQLKRLVRPTTFGCVRPLEEDGPRGQRRRLEGAEIRRRIPP